MSDPIVILGGGHAAAQLCASLAEAGHASRVTLVSEDALVPYQRPPLSKGFLKNPDEAAQPFRPETWYREQGIALRLSDAAVAVNRDAHTVTLRSGAVLPWAQLVFATGSRPRRLPGLPEGLANVALLRSAADAQSLRQQLASASSLTVIGGGLIGLEVAATARALGKNVTVLESAPRLLGRAASPGLSAHLLDAHRAAGIDVRLGVRCGAARVEGHRLASIEVDGHDHPLDLLLVAIGATPETALAQAAGIACDDGIVVDEQLRTRDPSVFAIGDCARFANRRGGGSTLRLESVQNANDQARAVAATLAGTPRSFDALPWFWSDQGSLRVQMTGLAPPEGTVGLSTVRRPGPNDAAFSLVHYVDGRFVCIETVNAPADHIMGRKLLEAGRSPSPETMADPGVPLKTHLA